MNDGVENWLREMGFVVSVGSRAIAYACFKGSTEEEISGGIGKEGNNSKTCPCEARGKLECGLSGQGPTTVKIGLNPNFVLPPHRRLWLCVQGDCKGFIEK